MTTVSHSHVTTTQRLRMGIEPQSMLVERATNRILRNEVGTAAAVAGGPLSTTPHADHRTDLADVNIYICAPEVLLQFSSNFDYQTINQHFINGVIAEEELGNKIMLYPVPRHSYAATVGNWRAYDAISRDILQRWVYPLSPDTNILPSPPGYGPSESQYLQRRRNLYQVTCDHDAESPR